jgi:hypothetical protein
MNGLPTLQSTSDPSQIFFLLIVLFIYALFIGGFFIGIYFTIKLATRDISKKLDKLIDLRKDSEL